MSRRGGGFNRRSDSRADSQERDGFARRGGSDGHDPRHSSSERGGFRRQGSGGRGDNADSGNGARGDASARGGFERRGDSTGRGGRGAGDRGGFKRRGGGDGVQREASTEDFRTQREQGRRGGFGPRGAADSGIGPRRGEPGRTERTSGADVPHDRRRGGEGARTGSGRSLDRRPARPEEPDLPEEVQATDLDSVVRRDLLSLDKGNAETVARHLVMAVRLIDDDPGLALAHARAARQRAGRIAVVRETAGVVAYHAGEWAEALAELRTARRMSGGSGLLAVMADCERGLGRPERAIELGRGDEARALQGDEATELRIVIAGARMDLGQYDQAVVTLQTSDLDPARTGSTAARLFYAYADALVAAGRTDEGLTWFFNAAAADLDGETDAEERATELTGETGE
ncbi:hypothetical protein ACL02S_16120 [Nocardia sp. 004]|uniref:hypothetical protein n=1 Tax=Nocardia sp. 004 TaxID=3385978 RepID=UPI0039A0AC5D